jgi:DNA replicative helicase MCM subunit Mcm2 (Cdc46/Mcm family)
MEDKKKYYCDECGKEVYVYPTPNGMKVVLCSSCVNDSYEEGLERGYNQGNVDSLFGRGDDD